MPNGNRPTRPSRPPARRRNSKRNAKRRPRSARNSSGLTSHRRFIMYPTSPSASWLDKLAWFASVALKLVTSIVTVGDDYVASEATIGSGVTMILGPGDFASQSPFASAVTTTHTDKEVVCLKALPFERCSMRRLDVSIVPSADLGVRGGMYAALLIKIDDSDAQLCEDVIKHGPKLLVQKYSCNYDDIIKHPRAKMSSVTTSLKLSINVAPRPRNIRISWDDELGYINAYPQVALLIAFSDLASSERNVSEGYSPAKSLFEVHCKAYLNFHEPAELKADHDKGDLSKSCYTPKVLCTGSKNINKVASEPDRTVCFFDHRIETNKPLDVSELHPRLATLILKNYGREDLLDALKAKIALASMEM